MQRTTIAILGMGPRGLSILERICALYNQFAAGKEIQITLIDRCTMGTGAHSIQQPDHLLVNTVACQITLFGDPTVKGIGPVRKGPNFHQWANDQNYRNLNGCYLRNPAGKAIQANEYLPRRLLGEYLSWAYREILHTLPAGLTVNQMHHQAVNLQPELEGKTVITLENNQRISADFIYLTTGHNDNMPTIDDYSLEQFVVSHLPKNPHLKYYPIPYPVNKLAEIEAGTRVVIQGIGLTAYDVISQLTLGRGGKFVQQNGKLTYRASGNEPKMAIYSRQTLPFSSRGLNQKGVGGQYIPAFITAAAIKDLRMQHLMATGSAQLDFTEQVFPLLHKEMCYVYRSTLDEHWQDPQTFQPATEDEAAINQLLYPHHGQNHAGLTSYTEWFMEFLRDDLQAAEAGNLRGPVKAATDVIRDVRDILRDVIDHAGLRADSHRHFLEHFNPLFNRIAVGPPKQRNQQLLALMEAGIVTLAGGQNATLMLNTRSGHFEVHSQFADETSQQQADVLIKAKIANFSPLHDVSPLMHNLTASGIIRPFINHGYHPGGLDVDNNQHPLNRHGQAQKTLWVLGNPAEGANFYTYVLPRPLVNSRFLVDAGRCVIDMYQQMQYPHPRTGAAINAASTY